MTAERWKEMASLDGLRPVLDRADKHGTKNRVVDRIHRAALAEALLDSKGVILDFGSGVGRLSGWLAARSSAVVGLEVTPEMIAAARQRVTVPKIGWAQFDGAHLPLLDATIDQVVSVYVLQHVTDNVKLIDLAQEFARVLKPGGRLVVIEQASTVRSGSTDLFLKQRQVSEYVDAFQSAHFAKLEARPIRVSSAPATLAARIHGPEWMILRLAQMSLALAQLNPRPRAADFLMAFERT